MSHHPTKSRLRHLATLKEKSGQKSPLTAVSRPETGKVVRETRFSGSEVQKTLVGCISAKFVV